MTTRAGRGPGRAAARGRPRRPARAAGGCRGAHGPGARARSRLRCRYPGLSRRVRARPGDRGAGAEGHGRRAGPARDRRCRGDPGRARRGRAAGDPGLGAAAGAGGDRAGLGLPGIQRRPADAARGRGGPGLLDRRPDRRLPACPARSARRFLRHLPDRPALQGRGRRAAQPGAAQRARGAHARAQVQGAAQLPGRGGPGGGRARLPPLRPGLRPGGRRPTAACSA